MSAEELTPETIRLAKLLAILQIVQQADKNARTYIEDPTSEASTRGAQADWLSIVKTSAGLFPKNQDLENAITELAMRHGIEIELQEIHPGNERKN